MNDVEVKGSKFIHQKRYTQRQQLQDRRRVNVWIPEQYRAELRAIAGMMREGTWEGTWEEDTLEDG